MVFGGIVGLVKTVFCPITEKENKINVKAMPKIFVFITEIPVNLYKIIMKKKSIIFKSKKNRFQLKF
jgi:hypothetical protein